jgi:RNA polymerase sigma-70 factor (ECF subfamily)
MNPSKPVVNVAVQTGRADQELVARHREGDLGAFEELYRRHAGRLYSLALRMVRNADDAEDLLQEIFLQAHRKLGSFKGESTLVTWLYRLAMNHCLDYLRSKAGRMSRATSSLDADTCPPQPAAPPGQVELTVSRLDLERAIEQLPEGCRAAFLLHDVEGFEHREVAGMLGIAEGTSKSQVHKARLRLRAILRSTVSTWGRA